MADHCCRWWGAYLFDHPGRRLFQKPEKILAPYISPGMTVLDVGPGMGFFAIQAAKLVGDAGKVICADVQQEMLDILYKRAEKKKAEKPLVLHLCEKTRMGVEANIDFAYSSWAVHELPDLKSWSKEMAALLVPGAKLLIIEPKGHVTQDDLERNSELICRAGFKVIGSPKIGLSRSHLLERIH